MTSKYSQDLNIIAYNCRGLNRLLKNNSFFEFIFNYEIIILIETFFEKEKTILDKKFENYTIGCIPAVKKQKEDKTLSNGRAREGILCAVKSDLKEFVKLETFNGKLVIEIAHSGKNYCIAPIYLNRSICKQFNELLKSMKDNGFQNIMFLGDFNARIGNHQNPQELLIAYDGAMESIRKSLDINTNTNGLAFQKFMGEHSFVVLNGSTKGDYKGEFTCVSHEWLIDYCAIKGNWIGVFNDFEILNGDFLQRFPLSVTLTFNSKKLEVLFYNCSSSINSLENPNFISFLSDYDVIILSAAFLDETSKADLEDYVQVSAKEMLCAVKMIWKECLQIEKFDSKLVIKMTQRGSAYYIIPVNFTTIIPIIRMTIEQWEEELEKLKMLILELLKTGVQNIMLLGGFFARIGNFQNPKKLTTECTENAKATRKFCDKRRNCKGDLMLKMFEEQKFLVLNGTTRGDVKGGFTSMSKSVIDYCIVSGNWCGMMKDFTVVKDIDFSDHNPLHVKLSHPLSI